MYTSDLQPEKVLMLKVFANHSSAQPHIVTIFLTVVTVAGTYG